jgi:hypothetical protein
MGKCGGDDKKPYVFTLQELVDVGVGDTKEMTRGCGPNLGGTGGGSGYDMLKNKGFGWPENGEFEWGGLGNDCGLCSVDYGCECAGGDAIGGKRGQVKRVKYLGDKQACCLRNAGQSKNAVQTVNGTTCDPMYRDPSSSECTAVIKDYCNSGANKIVNDPLCRNLVNTNGTVYNRLMSEFCNASMENADTNECIEWCASNSTLCTKLNTKTDCEKYSIQKNLCSPQAITDVVTKCKKYGMLSEQGMPIGSYQCNANSIAELEADCKKFGIDLSTCSASGIDSKNLLMQNQEQSALAMQQSQDQFSKVSALVDSLNTDNTKQETAQNAGNAFALDKTTIMIIVVAIVVFLLCSSSVAVLLKRRK